MRHRRMLSIRELTVRALTAASLVLPTVAMGVAPVESAVVRPLVSDWAYLGNSGTPPSQAACNAVNRRCFNPAAMANSYDYASLHAAGNEGQGTTIAIVDSF